jgi:hypothetical protein
MSHSATIAQLPPPLPTFRPAAAAAVLGECYEGIAIGSLVCSLAGAILVSPLFGIVAVILGVVARRKMRRSGNFIGYGVARAGLIIGSIEVAILVLIVLMAVAAIIAGAYVHPAEPAHAAVRIIAI